MKNIRLALLSCALMFALISAKSVVGQTVDHWETVIHASDTWRYFVGTAAPDPNWKSISFNDAAWQQGAGGFGYADGDDNTIIPATMSVYIRKSFNIVDISKIESAVLHMDYDDAFVAYLNGTEIARANIGTVGIEPTYNDGANGWLEAQMFQGNYPPEFSFSAADLALLNQGNNILTIQVHNESPTSSDLSCIPFLSFGINDGSFTYTTLPSWFVSPFVFTSSYLPIIEIITNGQTIVDDPDINIDLGIIDNGPGNLNSIGDPYSDYQGTANIEIRGNSSQMFPKKSYGMETTDAAGLDLDTIILGFPKEEDWILHAPYSDKSLMRNVLIYRLAREMGWYATRTKYFELVIDGDYRGVYVLMEKIKRDNDRVDIARLDSLDLTGDDLTGGYIWKVDHGNDPGWASQYDVITVPGENLFFQQVYPKPFEILPVQQQYIQTFVDSFEDAIWSPTFHHPTSGKRYTDFIDLDSWVDNWILNEFSRNVDGFRLSSYFYKDKDSKGGKIVAGPAWDYNLAFGNGDYCNGADDTDWMYFEHCDDDNPFWWDHMWNDTVFTNAIKCRWVELRQTILADTYLTDMIDSCVNLLGDAVDRNFTKWPIMGTYVWPNPQPYSDSFPEEVQKMKLWVQNRTAWIDNNIPGNLNCPPPDTAGTIGMDPLLSAVHVKVYPNPSAGLFNVGMTGQKDGEYLVVVADIVGRIIEQKLFNSSGGQHLQQIDLGGANAGLYSLQIFRKGERIYENRLVLH